MDRKRMEEIAANLAKLYPLLKQKLIKPGTDFQKFGISGSTLRMLFVLEDLGALLASELAEHMGISLPNTVPIVRRLEERDFVERVHEKTDRRRVRIAITDRGLRFLKEVHETKTKDLAERLSVLSEEELTVFAQALRVMRESLTKLC
jgi:DNA-binding MarR family transcriptional regulator